MAIGISGKQIQPGTTPETALVPAFSANLLKADGTRQWVGDQDANSVRLKNLGAPINENDAARLADIHALSWKDKCVVATTSNITLSGVQTVDGISVGGAGERVCVRAQTIQTENGIYTSGSGAWTRAFDNDSVNEMRGAVVFVEQGSVNHDKRFAQSTDTFSTSNLATNANPIVWADIGSGTAAAFDVPSNKGMAASLATADGQLACATALAATPTGGAYVRVLLNGLGVSLGNDKTKCCWFSRDGGTTVIPVGSLVAGDLLYWSVTNSGFPLATTDEFDFDYAV